MVKNKASINTKHTNIIENKTFKIQYFKRIKENIKISSWITIEQMKRKICISIKYAKVIRRGSTSVQMW